MSKDREYQKTASTPFFSIGITTYDRVDMLIDAINSVLGQTFHDYEVMVSNDNPARTLTGETLGIHDPRVVFINQTHNLGEFHNMDYLLKASRGAYFTWLADDDYYAPGFLQNVYEALRASADAPPCVLTSFKISYRNPRSLQHGEKEIKKKKVLVYSGRRFLQDYWQGRIKVIGTTGFFTKQFLMDSGGFKKLTHLPIAIFSEYLLIMQISLLEKVLVIDAPLICLRVHDGSWSESNRDYQSSRTAGINFLKASMEIFQSPLAEEYDYRKNVTGAIKLILKTAAHTSARRKNIVIALSNFSYLRALKPLIWALRGSEFFHQAVRSYFFASMWFLLYFPRVLLVTVMPDSVKTRVSKMRYALRSRMA